MLARSKLYALGAIGVAMTAVVVGPARAPLGDAADALLGGTALAQNASFTITEIAKLDEPWAMAFLPDGRALVTEKRGALKVVALDGSGKTGDVSGVPAVSYGGQGGFGDVVLHPQFAANGFVYLSYAESAGRGGLSGAAVARAKLALDSAGGGKLDGLAVIWRQEPKVSGQGHFGHRVVFAPDGHLYISSGERQKFDPAQDMAANLGKILRLNDDGTVPPDNPFADKSGVTAQIWSLGHRRRRAQSRRARRELRLADRLERRSLRRARYSGSSDTPRAARAGRILESRDLAVEPPILRRQRVPSVARRRIHQRVVVPVHRASRIRGHDRARSAALRDARAHPPSETGPGRRAVGARRRSGRADSALDGAALTVRLRLSSLP
jgi:hypothetical protein